MPEKAKPTKATRQEILRSMLASFRIEGLHISEHVAAALLKKIEIRLAKQHINVHSS